MVASTSAAAMEVRRTIPMNNAQNPQSLLGKILRIDVDAGVPYAVPPDNPFAQGGGQPEIYALGFRNPFRFSFDRLTGALRVGDVGQDIREEIDVVVRGGNYGWKVWEGNVCRQGTAACNASAFVPPVTEYATHVGGRCAVTGGYVYRGIAGSLPSGTYIFGDYCTGEIFQGSSATVLMDTGLNIASFGETAAGEILVVDHGGTVYRLAPDSSPGPATRERTDFNGDGRADILWRNTAGQTYVWFVNGLSIASSGLLRRGRARVDDPGHRRLQRRRPRRHPVAEHGRPDLRLVRQRPEHPKQRIPRRGRARVDDPGHRRLQRRRPRRHPVAEHGRADLRLVRQRPEHRKQRIPRRGRARVDDPGHRRLQRRRPRRHPVAEHGRADLHLVRQRPEHRKQRIPRRGRARVADLSPQVATVSARADRI